MANDIITPQDLLNLAGVGIEQGIDIEEINLVLKDHYRMCNDLAKLCDKMREPVPITRDIIYQEVREELSYLLLLTNNEKKYGDEEPFSKRFQINATQRLCDELNDSKLFQRLNVQLSVSDMGVETSIDGKTFRGGWLWFNQIDNALTVAIGNEFLKKIEKEYICDKNDYACRNRIGDDILDEYLSLSEINTYIKTGEKSDYLQDYLEYENDKILNGLELLCKKENVSFDRDKFMADYRESKQTDEPTAFSYENIETALRAKRLPSDLKNGILAETKQNKSKETVERD